MNYHLHDHEQEQVEAIKQWWKDNGSAVILGISAGIIALAGWRFWQNYTQTRAEQASFLYEQVMQASGEAQSQKLRESAQNLLQEYPSSTYAALASLMLAQVALKEQQLDAANTHLQWVIDNAKLAELVTLARLRKAQVLFSQGQADAALALLKQGDAGAMRPGFDELEGDILLSQGKRAEAKTAYAKALTQLPAGGASATLQMKLDDLGASEAIVAALDPAEVLPPPPKLDVKMDGPSGATLPLPEITTEIIAPPPGASAAEAEAVEADPAATPAEPAATPTQP